MHFSQRQLPRTAFPQEIQSFVKSEFPNLFSRYKFFESEFKGNHLNPKDREYSRSKHRKAWKAILKFRLEYQENRFRILNKWIDLC